VTAGDQIIAQALRKSGKPVILAANKCEGRVAPPDEAYGLGLAGRLRFPPNTIWDGRHCRGA